MTVPAVFATRSTATRVTSFVAPLIGMSTVTRIVPGAVKAFVTVTQPPAPTSLTNPRTVEPAAIVSVSTTSVFVAAQPIAEVASIVTAGMKISAPFAPEVRTSPHFAAFTAFVAKDVPA